MSGTAVRMPRLFSMLESYEGGVSTRYFWSETILINKFLVWNVALPVSAPEWLQLSRCLFTRFSGFKLIRVSLTQQAESFWPERKLFFLQLFGLFIYLFVCFILIVLVWVMAAVIICEYFITSISDKNICLFLLYYIYLLGYLLGRNRCFDRQSFWSYMYIYIVGYIHLSFFMNNSQSFHSVCQHTN